MASVKLQPSQRGALLTGLLVGMGTGALAGWRTGLGVAVAVTALLLMQSFIPRPSARGANSSHSVPTSITPHGVEIYHVTDPLLVDRAATFLETLRSMGQRPAVLILDLTRLDGIDATTFRVIKQVLDRESGSGMLVLVAGRGSSMTEAITRFGALPESGLFDSLDDALQRARVHLWGKGGRPPSMS
jgi:MFS superfamily sulfate permease-like transporter